MLTVLAFALVARRRLFWAAAVLGGAVLLKQFALVALPFLALAVLAAWPRRDALRAGGIFGLVVAVGMLPFVLWDPGAFWADTIEYGGSTYRIVGYGLSGLLVKAGLIGPRTDGYPFLPLLALVWLPVTAWLLWTCRRAEALWPVRSRLRCVDLPARLARPRLPRLVSRLAARRCRHRAALGRARLLGTAARLARRRSPLVKQPPSPLRARTRSRSFSPIGR